MSDIERLREEVSEAEKKLRHARRFAEMDLEAAASSPERIGFHHGRNADRVKFFEEKLKEAQARLDAAITTR